MKTAHTRRRRMMIHQSSSIDRYMAWTEWVEREPMKIVPTAQHHTHRHREFDLASCRRPRTCTLEGARPQSPVGRRPSSFWTLLLAAGAGFAAAFLLLGSRFLSLVSPSSSETLLWARASSGLERAGGLNRTSEASPQYDTQGVRVGDHPSNAPHNVAMIKFLHAHHAATTQMTTDPDRTIGRQQPSPPRDDEQPIFNASSCIWINFMPYGRSGNRLIKLRHVNEVLARCSGVAVTRAGINDDTTVFFPPTLVASGFSNDNLVGYKALEIAARMCREVNYTSAGFKDTSNHCGGSGAQYRLQQGWWTKKSSTGLEQPALLPHVVVEKRAWEHTFDNSTMLMYFRGGDILRAQSPRTVQPSAVLALP